MKKYIINNIRENTAKSLLAAIENAAIPYEDFYYENNTLKITIEVSEKCTIQIQAKSKWGFQKSIFFGSKYTWCEVYIYLPLNVMPNEFDFKEKCLYYINSSKNINKGYLSLKELKVIKVV
jgi:hypothetical protein